LRKAIGSGAYGCPQLGHGCSGTLVFPAGVFACNNLLVDTSRIRLVGLGAGWFSGTHTQRGSTLVYNGTAGGDILTLASPSGASTQKISDCAVLGLALDGTDAADLTGPAGGHAVEIELRDHETVVFAPSRTEPNGRAIHARAVLVAPTRPGRFLAAAAERGLPVR
jgi:hypothetical protein